VSKGKIFVALALVALFFACGRAGGEVFTPEQPPTPTTVSIPTPEPTAVPTPTSTPDPEREWEETFFPVLPQLRQIPGNENARVDWSSPVLERGKGFLSVSYKIQGLVRIPLDLGEFEEEQLDPTTTVRIISLPPEGRVRMGCTVGEGRLCEVEGGDFLLEDDNFVFIIESTTLNLTRWAGPVPPGLSREAYEKARPLP
jgi:hypothetical protein